MTLNQGIIIHVRNPIPLPKLHSHPSDYSHQSYQSAKSEKDPKEDSHPYQYPVGNGREPMPLDKRSQILSRIIVHFLYNLLFPFLYLFRVLSQEQADGDS